MRVSSLLRRFADRWSCTLVARRRMVLAAALAASFGAVRSDAMAATTTEDVLAELRQQNALLRDQLSRQQRAIDTLRERLDTLAPLEPTARPATPDPEVPRRGPGRLILSGEAGLVFLAGTSESQYPNEEFRVDDANLYLQAELRRGLYAVAELQLSKRESVDETFHLGEFYLEWEDVFGAALPAGLLNLRFGRIDIPFGEEYRHRDPMANPLVSHSLSDFWGTDEGLLLYGGWPALDYAVAVQNGSQRVLRDHDSDKAVTLRLGWQANNRLRLSASALRTGDMDTAKEPLSELWIGNGVFRSIGSAATRTFGATLWQADAQYRWRTGHLLGAFGGARYDDDDPLADNRRDLFSFHLEGVQDLGERVFLAARYSELWVKNGYPLPGLGSFGKYFLGPLLTEELWRLGVGLGYRLSPAARLKFEYTLEEGTLAGGGPRRDLRQLAAQAALAF